MELRQLLHASGFQHREEFCSLWWSEHNVVRGGKQPWQSRKVGSHHRERFGGLAPCGLSLNAGVEAVHDGHNIRRILVRAPTPTRRTRGTPWRSVRARLCECERKFSNRKQAPRVSAPTAQLGGRQPAKRVVCSRLRGGSASEPTGEDFRIEDLRPQSSHRHTIGPKEMRFNYDRDASLKCCSPFQSPAPRAGPRCTSPPFHCSPMPPPVVTLP
jgi:hypothetical protein